MIKFNIFDLLFPKACMLCNKKIVISENEFSLCSNCSELLKKYEIGSELELSNCLSAVKEFYPMLQYKNEIRECILNYKFNGEIWRGKYLGRLLYEYLKRYNAFENIDYIVYVPISDKTFSKRGYDQTYEVAKEVSLLSNILIFACLKKDDRIKDNAAQHKSRIDRLKEKKYKYNEEPFKIFKKNVLLIDDVLTTGATLDECVEILLNEGANSVKAAVLATGRKDI